MKRTSRLFKSFLAASVFFGSGSVPVLAKVQIDPDNSTFAAQVLTELNLMREGKRGVACEVLVRRLDESEALVTIEPITSDEKTWHPNDRKGSRSHVVPLDTKLRSASRTSPVSSILYLHPSRIEPLLSLFKLGTFADELANAVDLAKGTYSGDYRIQTRRSAFFRNGWKDSMGGALVHLSDRVPTVDYQEAKKLGLISKEFAEIFPILDPARVQP